VGAGWALARLRRRPWRRLALDPLLRWLAIDGYGFHSAFFGHRRVVRERIEPRQLHGYQRRAFDQGVGRGLWFIETANPERIAATIGTFDSPRRPDLWSGAALAAAYAGGVGNRGYEQLAQLGDEYRPHLAQGVVFAAAARAQANNVIPQTETACQVICGIDASNAAALTEEALARVPRDGSGEAYESWRAAIRLRFSGP
jgi:hypothetical protein